MLTLVRKGKVAAPRLRRAHIQLHAGEGRTDEAIAESLHTNRSTVERTRRHFVEQGLEAALSERPRPGAAPTLDQKGQATLLALACSNPPEGRTCWTMQLLADALVERRVGAISDETVRRTLKKPAGALAARALVHPRGKPSVRGGHGGRPRPVCRTL